MRSPSPLLLPLALSLSLAGCWGGSRTASPPAPAATPRSAALDVEQIRASAPVVGELVRAATVCGLPISITAQDRAARVEGAALNLVGREGGQPAMDNYLRSVQPPAFDPRLRDRDRAQYCGQKRLDVERMDGFLSGPDGAALAQRADALLPPRGRPPQ